MWHQLFIFLTSELLGDYEFARILGAKAAANSHQSSHVLAKKTVQYASSLLEAKWNLRAVTRVGKRVRTISKPSIQNFGSMIIGDDTVLRSVIVPLELSTDPGGVLTIGKECSLNYGVSIGVTKSVTLGDRVRLGPYVMIIDSEFHSVYNRKQRPVSRPVIIEDDVWIAAKSSVLPGITIGRGSIVGTGSTVTADVPPFTIVAGSPARVIKKIDPERFETNRMAR